jgi:hypothetical protein
LLRQKPRSPAAGPGPSYKEDPPLCSTHTSNFSAILQELGITTVVFVKFEDAVQEIFPVQVLPGGAPPGRDQRPAAPDRRFVCRAG